jgi:NtrC-family two-component system response regulator AlgB
VKQGAFREDLFYRLNVITVHMPPLRERPEDVVRFAEAYLKFFAAQGGRTGRTFSEAARRHLLTYPWPGNLRELRNAIERAAILADGPHVNPHDLPSGIGASGSPASPGAPQCGDPITIEALEAVHIRAILTRTQSLSEAASVLGIDQATLYRKRKKLGLDAEPAT